MFGRFLLSGGFNTVVTYLIYLLALLVLPYWAAYSAAYIAGIVLAYVLSRYWVFWQHRGVASVVLFPLVYVIQYILGLAVVWVWVNTLHLDAKYAPLAAVALTVPITYVLSRHIFMTASPAAMWRGAGPSARAAVSATAIAVVACVLSVLFPQESLFVEIEGAQDEYFLYVPSAADAVPVAGQRVATDWWRTGVAPQTPEKQVIRFKQLGKRLSQGLLLPSDIGPRFAVRVDTEGRFPAGVVGVRRSLLFTEYSHYPADVFDATADLYREEDMVRAIGPEPMLLVDLSRAEPSLQTHLRADAFFLLALMWAALIAARGYGTLVRTPRIRWALAIFAVTVVVIIAKAVALPLNHGPDEEMHVGSIYWYFENLRPPAVALGDTPYLNVIWQSSYVLGASADWTYLLTARTGSLMHWVAPHVPDFQLMRIAEILLLVIIGGFCSHFCGVRYGVAYLAAWALIPQLAYTATYVNGDVLSFATCLLACALLLGRPIDDANRAVPIVQFVAAIFLLVNAKSNYLPLLVVLLVWSVIHWRRQTLISGRALAWLFALSPLIFYRRIFNYWDQAEFGGSYLEYSYARLMALLNGDQAPQRRAFDQALAFFQNDAPFRYVQGVYERMLGGPSHYDYGVLLNPDWYVSSFHSLFGVFGYMNSPVSWWLLAVPIGACMAVLWYGVQSREQFILLASTVALTLGASLFYSISQGYQAQGRYLFPIVCLGMVLLARGRREVCEKVLVRVVPPAAVVTWWALVSFLR